MVVVVFRFCFWFVCLFFGLNMFPVSAVLFFKVAAVEWLSAVVCCLVDRVVKGEPNVTSTIGLSDRKIPPQNTIHTQSNVSTRP